MVVGRVADAQRLPGTVVPTHYTLSSAPWRGTGDRLGRRHQRRLPPTAAVALDPLAQTVTQDTRTPDHSDAELRSIKASMALRPAHARANPRANIYNCLRSK
jgi:hypothetical protein